MHALLKNKCLFTLLLYELTTAYQFSSFFSVSVPQDSIREILLLLQQKRCANAIAI